MSDSLALGLTALAMLIFYIWFVFWWATNWLANLVALPFSKENDDEVVETEYRSEGGIYRPYTTTRGDYRVRLIVLLLIWPALGWLHYNYFEQIVAGFEWTFEDMLAPLIVSLFDS
jgi:hypothetical protein